ncbi:hypothetical protein GE09DRAFT_491685 [Coniochaeta sp. 2T2.1]|nr:hypothetical protein GE09DRAFT_491685 [Coniochaeta sp. 2T2.1]
MVYFNVLTAAVILNAIGAVTAYPDTVNWGRNWREIYHTGLQWGEWREEVRQEIEKACEGRDGHRGALQDVYYKPWKQSPHSAKLCVNVANFHVDFEIANLNPHIGFTLAKEDCYYRLFDRMLSGERGGEEQLKGWWFRLDPNEGPCR